MAKRIAIFCDGTWNTGDGRRSTNVVKLRNVLKPVADDGVRQEPIYLEGVGTKGVENPFRRFVIKYGGGAFGWGLLDILFDAYLQLIDIYETGDEIYLFGFSRGAYTARSLAGLIRASGIPTKENRTHAWQAVTRYKDADPSTHPKSPESYAFRYRLNPAIRTDSTAGELEWRQKNNLDPGERLQIPYVGVWDTVGALGVPNRFAFLSSIFNGKYKFHDTELSSNVQTARHAAALDENRWTFPPTLWTNLDGLNREAKTRDHQPYRQIWFAGDHASIGGGYDMAKLSDITLGWIAEGASAQGLDFDAAALAQHSANADPLADTGPNSRKYLYVRTGYALKAGMFRRGPWLRRDLSDSAAERWQRDAGYRPRSLNCLARCLVPPGPCLWCDCASQCRRPDDKDYPPKT